MPRIRLLSDSLISQIAAGEVVERPASVVKELIENALDAGAGRVEIELAAGGKRSVLVVDDGSGMDRDDALLAFDRHATSKIEAFEDLERIATLGFRGEALASIAAVARVELVSAVEPGLGHRVRIEGGRVKGVDAVAHPRGTRILVRSLFFNVPARKQFLKRPETELRRVVEVVQGYVLARPDVHFSLRHEGRELLLAPALTIEADDPASALEAWRQRISQLFGPTLGRSLEPIGGSGGASSHPRIRGFVGNRETARGGRRLFVFVNRRLIRDRAVLAVFYRTVREEWKGEDFPALFLFLELEPEEVDVNVHPQKAEVRFRDPFLLQQVGELLRGALARSRGEEAAPVRPLSAASGLPGLAWGGLGGRVGDAHGLGGAVAESAPSGRHDLWPAAAPHTVGRGGPVAIGEGASRLAQVAYAPLGEASPVPLSGRGARGPATLRLLGQYKGTLILLEGPDGLYLIDQHVAHERILYERFRRALEGERPQIQNLLQHVLLELGPAEAHALAELQGELETCGFVLTELSGNSLALVATPATLSVEEAERLLLSLATRATELASETSPAELRRRLLDALAASQSCRAAVKMHHPLAAEEMERVVSELFAAENPYACPHGRPIVLRMTDTDLERRFGRR